VTTIPQERAIDSTPALLAEGYEFVSNRCRRHGSDVFQARIDLQPTICMRGRDAAELFYDTTRFQRSGAAPRRLRRTLFGEGGVQGMDDEAHRHRKALFLDLLGPERIRPLVARVDEQWRASLPAWERAGGVTVHEEAGRLLTDAVHRWVGIELERAEIEQRRCELQALIVGGAGLGPDYLRGRIQRIRAERRLARLVTRVRRGETPAPDGSALQRIARHRELDRRPLATRVAAVELLNVLRPTVAVDRFITFVVLALHEHPRWMPRLRAAVATDDDGELERFVLEVRRYYPFFPFVAARVRRDFTWRGLRFPAGQRVLLDLYATDRDPDVWDHPHRFDPDRFQHIEDDPFAMIPQGGGDHATGHRCAGEWLTNALMAVATRIFVSAITYEVPEQDLRLRRGYVPALPPTGLRIEGVRLAARSQ
jgi:fatty-acid peroxygenase